MLQQKNKDEAEQTVRKDAAGQYLDLAKNNLVTAGKDKLSQDDLASLFKKIRIRYSLTPQCNIFCTFCSNEGLSYAAKKLMPADIGLVTELSDMLLESTPLSSIDFSGGEPTIHPDFLHKRYELVEWTRKHPTTRFSLHTNGINLNPEIIDQIADNFARIGISIHSFDFDKWNQITNTGSMFSGEAQKNKFHAMMQNIEYLASKSIGDKVFLKSVIMRGINDSKEELADFLDRCSAYGFHPKLLEFEPQYASQRRLKVGRKELFAKLGEIGCTFSDSIPLDDNPKCYYPQANFEYLHGKEPRLGLHSRFGCGEEGACTSCYDYLCMFIKPSEDGSGLYLKPCSVLDTRFDLTHAIKTGDTKQVLELFKLSREYLMLAPGLGSNGWNKEPEYDAKASQGNVARI